MHHFIKCIFLLIVITAIEALIPNRYSNRVIGRYTYDDMDEDDIVPSSRMLRVKSQMRYEVKNCRFGICEQVRDYPQKQILEVVRREKEIHTFFGNVLEPGKVRNITINSRNSGTIYEPFCTSMEVTMKPKMMVDMDNVMRLIVNVEGFTQTVIYQECSMANKGRCYADTLFDTDTRCEQKFNWVALYTFNETTEQGEYRKFKLPTACVCTYVNEKSK